MVNRMYHFPYKQWYFYISRCSLISGQVSGRFKREAINLKSLPFPNFFSLKNSEIRKPSRPALRRKPPAKKRFETLLPPPPSHPPFNKAGVKIPYKKPPPLSSPRKPELKISPRPTTLRPQAIKMDPGYTYSLEILNEFFETVF